eukprot:m.65210 g.65210  ORF g.65210 m.65210 type:complete len:542 (-) comp8145_c0_seq1:103-1728(-)
MWARVTSSAWAMRKGPSFPACFIYSHRVRFFQSGKGINAQLKLTNSHSNDMLTKHLTHDDVDDADRNDVFPSIQNLQPSAEGKLLKVTWSVSVGEGPFSNTTSSNSSSTSSRVVGTFTSEYSSTWLRHNCQCPSCWEPSSGQRTVLAADLVVDNAITNVSFSEVDAAIQVASASGHVIITDQDFLLHHTIFADEAHGDAQRNGIIPIESSLSASPQEGFFFDYSSIIQSKNNGDYLGVGSEERYQWLRSLGEHGFAIVKNVPSGDANAVVNLANSISQPQPTIYGQTFDVEAREDPINIAYTNVHLSLHQDIAYYESAPGLQFLHAYKFDACVEGGASLLLDLFQAATVLRCQHPSHFETLRKYPLRLQKVHYSRDMPVHMVRMKPVITTDNEGNIVDVTWAPPFEGTFPIEKYSALEVDEFYSAYTVFSNIINEAVDTMANSSGKRDTKGQDGLAISSSSAVPSLSCDLITYRLSEGDVLTFNNRRMLHGRTSFLLNGGKRHLKGVYVNIDEFASALNYECISHNEQPPTHLGNGQINIL